MKLEIGLYTILKIAVYLWSYGPLSPVQGDDEAERFFKMERQLMDRTQRNQMTLKQRLEFRKFKMLKLMVMYLQQIPLFGKYCFYGCYCFPNMGQDFTVGKGKPMDEVDSKCRDFSSQGCKMDCEKLRKIANL